MDAIMLNVSKNVKKTFWIIFILFCLLVLFSNSPTLARSCAHISKEYFTVNEATRFCQ